MGTTSFEWLFRDDGLDFRAKMVEFIRTHFAGLLRDETASLDTPEGLERLRALTWAWVRNPSLAPSA